MSAVFRIGFVIMALLAAGCLQSLVPAADRELAVAAQGLNLTLACDGPQVKALETGALGSCWGHYGHHTYLLDPPVVVERVAGNVTAVEAEVAGIQAEPAIGLDASLDGRAWQAIGAAPYPASGTGFTEERHTFAIDVATTPTAARFLRIHMPLSRQEGLAGYLDHTDLRIAGHRALALPQVAPRQDAGCDQGILESFVPAHPCWFGGYDQADATTGATRPDSLHLAAKPTGTYYDAPSFLHTYFLPNASGPLLAHATVGHWRSTNQFALCAAEGQQVPVHPELIAQASANGTTWREVGRTEGEYGAPIEVAGRLPDGTQLVRLMAAGAPGDAADPACHHPVGMLTASSVSLGGSAR